VAEENLSMLYITHNLGVARQIADRIYVMYGGNIVETGPTEELFAAPRHPYTVGLIESIPKLTGFEGGGIDGSIPDYTDPPSGCRFHPRCPAYMEGECEAADPEPVRIDEGHEAACFLYDGSMTKEESATVAEREIRYGDEELSRALTGDAGGEE
jgi:oligopeptide/dipeptide ABC transporter ATP-binding protein